MNAAIHWSGPVLVGGAVAFGLALILISARPVIATTVGSEVAAILLLAAALLLLSLPAMYAVQADAVGVLGLVGHALLSVGLLLVVMLAATPLLHPAVNAPIGEHPIVFVLGIALTLGLLITAIATFQAGVFPRPAAALLLVAMIGFGFVFFVAEFLPSAAGQVGTIVFGSSLALGFAWIGVDLWLRNPGP